MDNQGPGKVINRDSEVSKQFTKRKDAYLSCSQHKHLKRDSELQEDLTAQNNMTFANKNDSANDIFCLEQSSRGQQLLDDSQPPTPSVGNFQDNSGLFYQSPSPNPNSAPRNQHRISSIAKQQDSSKSPNHFPFLVNGTDGVGKHSPNKENESLECILNGFNQDSKSQNP